MTPVSMVLRGGEPVAAAYPMDARRDPYGRTDALDLY